MDVKNIKISISCNETAAKRLAGETVEVLNIRVKLGEHGLCLFVEAGLENKAAFDNIMGSGWTNRFGNEIGDILERSMDLNLLLLKRGSEIVTRTTEKMRKEGRL